MAYSVKELLDAARARLKVAFEQVDTDGGDPVLAPVNVVRTAEGEALSVQVSGSIPVQGADGENPASETNPLPAVLAAGEAEVGKLKLNWERITATYSPRDTSLITHDIDHLLDGVIDQVIAIKNGTDANLTIILQSLLANGVNVNVAGQQLWSGAVDHPDGHLTAGHYLEFVPEVGAETSGFQNRVYAIPALRTPRPRFRLRITPKTAPTTGSVTIDRYVRRS